MTETSYAEVSAKFRPERNSFQPSNITFLLSIIYYGIGRELLAAQGELQFMLPVLGLFDRHKAKKAKGGHQGSKNLALRGCFVFL